MKIYKCKIDADHIEIPAATEILCVRTQNSQFGNGLFLWARVKEDNGKKIMPLSIIPTGGDVPDDSKYLGTFETLEGMIFHVFTP